MPIVLETATPDDEDFLRTLFTEVRGPEFAPLSLPAQTLAELLEMQRRAQRMAYAQQFPQAVQSIIRVDGQRAGNMLVNRSGSEMHVVDIALLPNFRGAGTGGQLLKELCSEAELADMPLRLSVRKSNPARRLYDRMGFRCIGNDGANYLLEWTSRGTKRQPMT